MFKQLISTPSLLRVLEQTLINKVLEGLGPSFLERRWVPLHDVHDDTVLWFADVGRVAVRQLHREDAIRPNIYLSVVASLTFDELGRHPADCADLAGPCISLRRQLR